MPVMPHECAFRRRLKRLESGFLRSFWIDAPVQTIEVRSDAWILRSADFEVLDLPHDDAGFRYEAIDKIGAGSLFAVYRARDRSINRTVALKVLRTDFTRNARFSSALRRAVERTVNLPHAHIARVHEVGEEDGNVYIAVEVAGDETLHDRLIRDAPISQTETIGLLEQICEAIHYAHRNGVVHGDIRPHNIFIDRHGGVKVADFGIAEAFASTSLLQQDAMLRSVHYLAPERATGNGPTVRSDVYSLGVLAYQMLTGSLPFDGGSVASITSKHAHNTPRPLTDINPAVSTAVQAVILKCLAKDPADRYTSVDQLIRDLRSAEAGLTDQLSVHADEIPASAPAPVEDEESYDEPPFLPNVLWSLGIIVLCVALVVGGLQLLIGTNPPEVTVPDIVGMTMQQAEQKLNHNRLRMRVTREAYDDKIPKSHIVSASPAPGLKVKANRIIEVAVSQGSELIAVPDVREQPLDRAQQLVSQSGLRVGAITKSHHDVIPEGYVVSQDPQPDQHVTKGTALNLELSLGPDKQTAEDRAAIKNQSKKSARVRVVVPQGPAQQRVRIVVSDVRGDRTVYEVSAQPGDKIDQRVTGYGDSVTVRVFIAGEMVSEHQL